MFRLKVCGIDEAVPALFAFRADRVVSMLDVDIEEKSPEKFAKIRNIAKLIGQTNHGLWQFEDDDSEIAPTAPKLRTTRAILEWVTKATRGDERFLIHCHGGIGRSPAISLGVMLIDGFEPADAMHVLFASRVDQFTDMTAMWPNRAILRHLEILFNIPGIEAMSEEIVREQLFSQDQIEAIIARPRTKRTMITLPEPIVPSVTEEMWAEACKRK